MAQYEVRGHHKVVNGNKIWVEEYFRNGVQVSEAEAVIIRAQRKKLKGPTTNMAALSSSDPTLGGYDATDTWTPETKQAKLMEVQSTLNPAALTLQDRQLIEYHMEEFLQNSDPTTDDAMHENLNGVIEEVQRRVGAARVQAEDMLNQLGVPHTERGREAQQLLHGVVNGQGPLDANVMSHFDDTMHYERQARNSSATAQELLPSMMRTAENAGSLMYSVNALNDYPTQEALPRLRNEFEQTAVETRTLIARVSDDPALARQFENNLYVVQGALLRSEEAIQQMYGRTVNGMPVDRYAVDQLMMDTQTIQRQLEEMGAVARTFAANA